MPTLKRGLLARRSDDAAVVGTWSYNAPLTGKPPGKSPSGTMKATFIAKTCPGYRCNTIQIDYVMEAGTQKEYHPSAGTTFESTVRKAYLPNNSNGRALLKRLKYAFLRGLTFKVGGTCGTSASNDVITWSWSFIHHKTSLTGGLHGYPDPSYICNCNGELDKVGIPPPNMIQLPHPLEGTWKYSAPSTMKTLSSDRCRRVQQRPDGGAVGQKCSICLSTLSSSSVVKIETCQHCFHDKCLKVALKHQPNCPVCRKPIRDDEPQGKSPSGTMTISILSNNNQCRGFDNCCKNSPTIQIDYWMQRGSQKEYHTSPGTPYEPTTRRAYLPNNSEGRLLLERLKYAFMHGLTFTIGTSLTSKKSNVITWSSIPHKTTLKGGPFGYPDPNYLATCNEKLDALGVPVGGATTADSMQLLSG